MRAFHILLLVVLASCSGRPPHSEDPPRPPDPVDAARLAIAIEQGTEISYAVSSDRIPQLNRGMVSIRGLAPGVGSFEYRDKAGVARLTGRIDERGVITAPSTSADDADYLLFMSLVFLLPSGAISASPREEEVGLLPDPLVYVFGKASWTLGGEEEFLERRCRVAVCETTLDIAGRKDGRLTGRMKARITSRYDPASRMLLAVEARVRANYSNPAAVDGAPETTILLRLMD